MGCCYSSLLLLKLNMLSKVHGDALEGDGPSGSWLLLCSHRLNMSHFPGFWGHRADAAGLELR